MKCEQEGRKEEGESVKCNHTRVCEGVRCQGSV